MLLVFAFLSIFIFWSPSILIYISSATSTFIDNFTIYGKSLDNTPLKLPEVEIISPKNGESLYPSSELTIKGTSSDSGNTNCTVLTSVNNIQPYEHWIHFCGCSTTASTRNFSKAHRENKDLRANKENKELKENKDQSVHQDHQDHAQ
jgi:hypothetical protein